jgi:uncharacterized repeat protein (TIGR02543 family)
MKKLSILLLAVVALLFVGMYNAPAAQANLGQNTDLNVTVVEGKGLVNRTNQTLNVPHGFGSKVSVDISGLVNSQKGFAYYILNGEKIDTEIVNLTLSGSTNLVIVMTGAAEKAVSYVDTNGELLDVDYVTEGEPVFTGTNPTKPGYQFDAFVGSYDGDHAVYTAQYSRVDETLMNVDVTGGTKDLAEVKYNDVVTLSPTDAVNFKYWADMDGQVISTNPNYAFTALKNIEIQAVTAGEANTNPVIYLSNVTGITPNAKSFLGYVEGDFVEYGVLASNKEEVLTLDTLGVTVIPSQALNPETNEFLRSIPETEDLKSFRAYAKLADGGVVYSENNFFIQNQIGEPVSDLMITRYVEGAPGNRKAIQIFNGTGEAVDLSNYAVKVASNGGAWNLTFATLSGILAPNDVYVIRQSADGGWDADLTFDLNYNGDDAVGLFKNNVLIDVFGVQGEDPGSGWSLSGTGNGSDTVDKVVVRNVEVKSPSTTWNRSEWSVELAIPNANTDNDVKELLATFEAVPFTGKVDTRLLTVTLDNQGQITSQTVRYAEKINITSLPEKIGFIFEGWFDESNNLVDGTTPITKHMTLTAKFEIEHYTLTFDSNGGTPVAPITGDYASEIVAPAAPTKDGYTFTGWSPVLPETMPAGNQTYTATWTAIDYTITFNVDGGSVVEPLTQAYGSELVLPVPTKDGFNFVGWFADVDRTIPFEVTIMPLGNTTLYALWQDVSLSSTVTFEVNGGSEIAPVVVSNGEAVVKPVDPTKEGYTFDGWFSDVALENEYNFDTPVNTDITLYAKWNASTISMVANTDGASGVSASGFGLPAIFTVTSAKNSASNPPGIFSGGLRVYNVSGGGDGGSITISIDSVYVILSIKVNTTTSGYSPNIKFTYAETTTTLSNYYSTGAIVNNINANSITFQNVGSAQLRVTTIEITYKVK